MDPTGTDVQTNKALTVFSWGEKKFLFSPFASSPWSLAGKPVARWIWILTRQIFFGPSKDWWHWVYDYSKSPSEPRQARVVSGNRQPVHPSQSIWRDGLAVFFLVFFGFGHGFGSSKFMDALLSWGLLSLKRWDWTEWSEFSDSVRKIRCWILPGSFFSEFTPENVPTAPKRKPDRLPPTRAVNLWSSIKGFQVNR